MPNPFEFNPASINNKAKEIPAGENKPEQDTEKEKPFDLEFYTTDHSADYAATGNPARLRELYGDIKKDGVTSVRYDWRWEKIENAPGQYDQSQLERYTEAKNVMHEVGMEEPTIILSTIPKWALDLYKEGKKEEFFAAFKNYSEQVKNSLMVARGGKISRIQILNEWNNKIFTPVAVEDLSKLCQAVREVFNDYNPDIKIMGTLILSNLNEKLGFGTEINKYMSELEKIKDSFDVIAIDYYPGLWHLPVSEAGLMPKKEWFRQMEPLEKAFEKLASWGIEYELGEVGFPTLNKKDGKFFSEKTQRYYYDTFFRAFKHMLVDLRERGLKLPSRVGLYEAVNEDPKQGSLSDKVNSGMTFGMRKNNLERKLVLQGSPHVPLDEQPEDNNSQLKNIINYLRAPMEIEKEKSEHIPTSEEVLSLFEKLIGENKYEVVRKLEDEQGLYLWDIKIAQEDGSSTEYSYIRKGNYKERGLAGGSALETAIHITYFDNEGMPISGHSVAKFINGKWMATA